ncbi:hypothetical protein VTN77DRAFT_3584 [Rasamsonia byssochlamydoides]|uniref:uncharacterized protein n=1 Tax=Rasamsonia byssochlamydoides TaxID=89139 RepID=UPI003744A185
MSNGINGNHGPITTTTIMTRLFPQDQPPLLEELERLCSRTVSSETYPLASSIQKNIPIYEIWRFDQTDDDTVSRLQDEWHHILYAGPGVFVLKGLYSLDRYGSVLDAANATFQRIIEQEREQRARDGRRKGDHFAQKGANDRIWNSFSKHALADPHSFVEYYSNPWLARVCEAWLGPAYRITAQVNVVKPGGAPQNCHRDYHLGFQAADRCARYPRSIQVASQLLTLQGAVAHSAMPLDSGPTRVLPFSQLFEPGFVAYRREEFQQYFLERYVALPLEMGDGIFFNPALFHAAGANDTGDLHRTANLLQVSSAFGKTMESIDSIPLVEQCWDILAEKYKTDGGFSQQVVAFVQAVAEGYPFPTNLDNRPPAPSGMAPESEQELIMRGLKEGWMRERVVGELRQMRVDSACSAEQFA